MAGAPIKNYLRPNEVEECNANLRACDRQAKMIDLGYENRATHENVRQTREAVGRRLEQAPPDLSPDQRDKLAKRVKELEEKISVGMLSHEEMRRNPPGAVDQNKRWQDANKRNIHVWKNAQVALMKGASHSEVAAAVNVARLRPQMSRLNMDNSQIPAVRAFSFPTEKFKEGWDNIDWHREKTQAVDVTEALDSEE